MMRDAIMNFAKQFEFEPRIENAENFLASKRMTIVCGMGGSSQPADILKAFRPDLDIIVHKDYGLPGLPDERLKDSLIIACSYSGNTEEPIESLQEAVRRGLNAVAISTGGKLLELAKAASIPYIKIPDTKIQPRLALGFNYRALLKALALEGELQVTAKLAATMKPGDYEAPGRALAEKTRGRAAVIYASARNSPLAYMWKIKLNETGKIPAFYNVLPELNHNEMNGFDVTSATRDLSKVFYFIMLKDGADHPRVAKRMETLKKMYADRGLSVATVELTGLTPEHKFFSSLVLADWFALHTAELLGAEPEQVPMVEEFKRLIAD